MRTKKRSGHVQRICVSPEDGPFVSMDETASQEAVDLGHWAVVLPAANEGRTR